MSYFNNLLTATKTRYAAFRSDFDADGDTEDDSHISRVLRTYYQENQRPYPDWLGPPPNSRSQSPASSLTGSLRSTYGRNSNALPQNHGSSAASLSDIWDTPPQNQNQPKPGVGGRLGGLMSRGSQQHQQPQQQQLPPPGQRYRQSDSHHTVPPPAPTVTSAQQRIKERLWGGRSSPAAQTQQPTYQPPPPREQKPYMGAGMPWDDGDGGMGYQAPAFYGDGWQDNSRGGGGRRPDRR
ncbi:hypothetical protein EX30DRAFT_339504 [Ascodesmis nigricans]|uniref:Mso1 N-terminal domain-containing protein n=1 Tax=Ascodesmis nigricans TaxID=341454 RepID=A0A4S2N2J7_9PEZI|nr:hypothetical protein EX30DRAFT_339504 [Ascodesmis nigricans]